MRQARQRIEHMFELAYLRKARAKTVSSSNRKQARPTK